MASLIENLRYRPEIDGLRAIAVLAVVFFHADLGVPGGYIGVDVFFVISGYLITSLIIKDLESGTFTLFNFWERRIRRILPALGLVALLALVAGWFMFLPDDLSSLGKSAFYQALCAANIYFWRETGYFDGAVDEKPLLHTWSLAVEEQFYLLVPFLLLAIFRIPRLQSRKVILSVCGVVILSSLALSIYGVSRQSTASFYLLPSRAWELVLGSFVALLPGFTLNRTLREILSILALASILLPCFLYSKETHFPGMAALPPCLGAALFIFSTRITGTGTRLPAIALLLSRRPVVFIGLISYSLYLWHWPLFAFSRYWALLPLNLNWRFALVFCSLLLAIVSWRFIETPFRKRQYCPSRKSIFIFGAIATAVTAASGAMLRLKSGIPQRLPAVASHYAQAAKDSEFVNEVTTSDVIAGKFVQFGSEKQGAPLTWLVWGDSFAMAALPGFDAFLKEQGQAGLAATHSSTVPILNYFQRTQYGLGPGAVAFNDAVFAQLQARRIPNVVLIGRWSCCDDNDPRFPSNLPFETSLIATVRRIAKTGSRPWILLEAPTQPFDVPRMLARFSIRGQNIVELCATPQTNSGLIGANPEFSDKLRQAGGYILDPRPEFLNSNGSHYIVETDGSALYRDSQHMSAWGARKIILPLLRKTVSSHP
ncbi:MAG: acyltransferase family protein [Chthoniobacterales bacterium]